MDSFDDSAWDMLDCNFIDVASSSDFDWVNQGSMAPSLNIDFSQNTSAPMDQDSAEKKCTAKRFFDLSSMLEPGRAAKSDKLAILDDAIKILNQLKTENEEFKEENKKLQEEIKTLKAEKHELREEKMTLKTEKDKVEQQMKVMSSGQTPGFMSPHPSVYHPGMNKMTLVPSYSMYPMWHYLPPSVSDTSHDHELRPPAA
ncbi:hypothetical protein V2J09_023173 [Rumex salicifolius]